MASEWHKVIQPSSRLIIVDSSAKRSPEEDRHCQKTKDSTQWGVRVFTDFCNEVGFRVESASKDVPMLCQALKRLYAGARTKKCELYQLTAFRSLRYALKRHFEETIKVDIIKDGAFAEANEAFLFMEKRIKAEGKGLIRHYPPVEERDMARLKEYFKANMQNPTPRELLEYVWFILQYYMCRLGRDGQTELKITSFIIRTDSQGERRIVQNESEPLSNGNRENDEELAGGLIPSIKGDVLCPVRAFELYIFKLHQDLDRLFQKPKKVVDTGQPYWFERIPYGKTPLGGMMPSLSHKAGLSKRYTNHSLRATAIEKLLWSGINKKEVRAISQRRSDSGTEVYGHSTTSVLQRKKMASILSNIASGGDQSTSSTTTTTTVAPFIDSNLSNSSPISPNRVVNKLKSQFKRLSNNAASFSHRKKIDDLLTPSSSPSSTSSTSSVCLPKTSSTRPSAAVGDIISKSFNWAEQTSSRRQQNNSTNEVKTRRVRCIPAAVKTSNTTMVLRKKHNNVDAESSQTSFMITDVHSCADVFTEQSIPNTVVKTVENPTHSYVVHKHQGNILSNMANLWKKGKLCDASIGNGTMKIMVHKVVLIALSPQLLTLPNANVTSGCFQLTFPQEIGGDALWSFAKYMYEGVVSLNEEVLEDMERIAKILNLVDLLDMCKLYRDQVLCSNNNPITTNVLVSHSNEPPSIMTNAITTELVDALPKADSPPLSTGVSFLGLPTRDVTQSMSRPVQQLQILPVDEVSYQLHYQSSRPVNSVVRVTPTESSFFSNDSNSVGMVKLEPSSPLKKRCREKDFLSSLPSRHSETHIVVHDDLSEPWQPHSYSDSEELRSPALSKRLKSSDPTEDSLSSFTHLSAKDFGSHPKSAKDFCTVKIELDGDSDSDP